mmetsp:Transcript_59803/g.156825  ORF Transcript_59803/g.156825 Transcript_59803/m.156825 type:complete len:117 (-) Transcript_59803:569-919(-)
MIMQQERFSQQSVETIVEVPVPTVQEELVYVPKITQQRRIQRQTIAMTVEVPMPMTQVEIARVPTIIQLPHHHHSCRADRGGACAYDSGGDRTRAEDHPASARPPLPRRGDRRCPR